MLQDLFFFLQAMLEIIKERKLLSKIIKIKNFPTHV